ncbi:hypothetical protein BC829DRAFT_378739 [Chytridium lagenaria]|nr:hypothetical protein BC829DRAFT_378739 [Chytridium lagenaria]
MDSADEKWRASSHPHVVIPITGIISGFEPCLQSLQSPSPETMNTRNVVKALGVLKYSYEFRKVIVAPSRSHQY